MNFDEIDNLNPEDIVKQYNDIVEIGEGDHDKLLTYGCWWDKCAHCQFGCASHCASGTYSFMGYEDGCWYHGESVCRSRGSYMEWSGACYFGLVRGERRHIDYSWTRSCI